MSARRVGVRVPPLLVLAALLLAPAGPLGALESKEIMQAVKNGVPNVDDNRVVLAELVAADW